MRMDKISKTATAVLLATMSFATGAARAANGRDFAGYFSLNEATVQGEAVELKLTLHLMNYSGADVDDATVAIYQSHPNSQLLATLGPIAHWGSGRDIVLARTLMVPADEFQKWRGRNQPALFIVDRQERRRWVQVTRRPILRQPAVEQHQ